MIGQLSIYDHPEDDNLRPCDYRFRRSIGQRVILGTKWDKEQRRGVIVDIDRYYTTVKGDDGKLYAGTPTNTRPEKEV